MSQLTRADLWSLEEYSEQRAGFRQQVIEHKKHRQVLLGEHASLSFEDAVTIKYQVQEMLRVERIFDRAGIEEELSAYNPLIPDGSNWKATMMFEYPDVEERRVALAKMAGIEHKVWAAVEGCERIYAYANEDLDRSNDEKTSAVHFLRFELPTEVVSALKNGAALQMGLDHPAMNVATAIEGHHREALIADLS